MASAPVSCSRFAGAWLLAAAVPVRASSSSPARGIVEITRVWLSASDVVVVGGGGGDGDSTAGDEGFGREGGLVEEEEDVEKDGSHEVRLDVHELLPPPDCDGDGGAGVVPPAAAALAVGLGAGHLFFLTDVDGLLADGEAVPSLAPGECEGYVEGGLAVGGMIPKLRAAAEAAGPEPLRAVAPGPAVVPIPKTPIRRCVIVLRSPDLKVRPTYWAVLPSPDLNVRPTYST